MDDVTGDAIYKNGYEDGKLARQGK